MPTLRYGDQEAQCRGYQRFRDTARDGDRPVAFALLDALEGVQEMPTTVPNSPDETVRSSRS